MGSVASRLDKKDVLLSGSAKKWRVLRQEGTYREQILRQEGTYREQALQPEETCLEQVLQQEGTCDLRDSTTIGERVTLGAVYLISCPEACILDCFAFLIGLDPILRVREGQ